MIFIYFAALHPEMPLKSEKPCVLCLPKCTEKGQNKDI